MSISQDELRKMLENPDIQVVGEASERITAKTPAVSSRPEMTEAERRFAVDVLEPKVAEGEVVFWTFEPQAIRVNGQSYTPDFHVLLSSGVNEFYEVKGSYTLGSQSRSSVKYRWCASKFRNKLIKFYWAKLDKSGSWRIREVVPKLPKHSQLG